MSRSWWGMEPPLDPPEPDPAEEAKAEEEAYQQELEERRDLDCAVRFYAGEPFAVVDAIDDYLARTEFAAVVTPGGVQTLPKWIAELAVAGLIRAQKTRGRERVLGHFDLTREAIGPGTADTLVYWKVKVSPGKPQLDRLAAEKAKGNSLAVAKPDWPPPIIIGKGRDYPPEERREQTILRRLAHRLDDHGFVEGIRAAVNLAGGQHSALFAILDAIDAGISLDSP